MFVGSRVSRRTRAKHRLIVASRGAALIAVIEQTRGFRSGSRFPSSRNSIRVARRGGRKRNENRNKMHAVPETAGTLSLFVSGDCAETAIFRRISSQSCSSARENRLLPLIFHRGKARASDQETFPRVEDEKSTRFTASE